jgi:hypothetical protein
MNNNFVIDQVKVGDLFQQIHPNFETVRSRVWELSKIQNQEVYLECLDKEKLNSKWIRIDIFQKFYQQIY